MRFTALAARDRASPLIHIPGAHFTCSTSTRLHLAAVVLTLLALLSTNTDASPVTDLAAFGLLDHGCKLEAGEAKASSNTTATVRFAGTDFFFLVQSVSSMSLNRH